MPVDNQQARSNRGDQVFFGSGLRVFRRSVRAVLQKCLRSGFPGSRKGSKADRSVAGAVKRVRPGMGEREYGVAWPQFKVYAGAKCKFAQCFADHCPEHLEDRFHLQT